MIAEQLKERLSNIFSAQGQLAKHISSYRPRNSQMTMAHAIADILSHHPSLADPSTNPNISHEELSLIVEAETGTGKTFAYLVPAMLLGGKVIISTGTKHLQDQLFLRDIPTIRDALNIPISVAMLKGRANYICHHYLKKTQELGFLNSKKDIHYLQEIIQFAKVTHSGDKSELASVPENTAIWEQVTSTKDNCLGQECNFFKECFVIQARKQAQQADLIVVNHHLFFADILLKDTGMAELLPSANTIIFDEAHQLPETASLFFGEHISTHKLLELARDLMREGLTEARDAADWKHLSEQLEYRARDLRLTFHESNVKLARAQLPEQHACFLAIADLIETLEHIIQTLNTQAERAESLSACLRRAQEQRAILSNWNTPDVEQTDSVHWLEVFTHSVQLHLTPLSIAPMFSEQRKGRIRSWIFTSATLSVKGDFTYYAEQMGLNKQQALSLPSPFNYPEQAILYVPDSIPSPSSPDFLKSMLSACIPVIQATKGGIFILCTSLRAVDYLAEHISRYLTQHNIQKEVFVQGQASRTELLDRFRSNGQAILIGSHSFWEGVDVSGEALSVVIIDKLPFSAPDEPILVARLEKLSQNGLNPFMYYQLPEAIIHLKQGTGRLIRSETDCGVLMICDCRLIEKSYGKKIWQSLPPFKRTRNQQVVIDFLHKIGKTLPNEIE